MARICKSKMNYLWIIREKVYGYTRFPEVTVKNLNFFKTVVCRIIMLIYGPHNILTPLMILLCLKLKLSNVFPAFDNSSEDNVKIVECHHLFDYFAVTRVQIVEYRWFIRQISKIQELVPPIQLAVVPKSVPNAIKTTRVNGWFALRLKAFVTNQPLKGLWMVRQLYYYHRLDLKGLALIFSFYSYELLLL